MSKSNVPEVVDYIGNQEEHHRKFNYQEEFLGLLRKHGVFRAVEFVQFCRTA